MKDDPLPVFPAGGPCEHMGRDGRVYTIWALQMQTRLLTDICDELLAGIFDSMMMVIGWTGLQMLLTNFVWCLVSE